MSVIVLVGGSFLGAWAWERVTPTLRAAGHDVHALTLTGFGDRAHLGSSATTLTTHATDIAAAIDTARWRDVVLVAHSYAGAPATVAAAMIPERIARMVYLAALLPVAGRTLFEIGPPGLEEMFDQMAAADGDGWRVPVISDENLDTYFGQHGLSAADRAWLRERAVGHPINTYRDRAPDDLSAVEKLPRTYVACAGDPGEPPVGPDTSGWDVARLDSGHWPMINRPVELATLIDRQASIDPGGAA
jgi:pimeloyl-ACP methyl ester carboxylesterase